MSTPQVSAPPERSWLTLAFVAVFAIFAIAFFVHACSSRGDQATAVPLLSQPAWDSGYRLGLELGNAATKAGSRALTEAQLHALSEIHGKKSTYTGFNLEYWQRGFKIGYQESSGPRTSAEKTPNG
ncbi:hypothetical protein [Oleiharenicola lentus]|uniref:hypothetical protein n=1 Tax=Oleiharenicola lentus TaxID=2508720 RepID=UPI003F66C226